MYKDPDQPCKEPLEMTQRSREVCHSFVPADNCHRTPVFITERFGTPALGFRNDIMGQLGGLLQSHLRQLGMPIGERGIGSHQAAVANGMDI